MISSKKKPNKKNKQTMIDLKYQINEEFFL